MRAAAAYRLRQGWRDFCHKVKFFLGGASVPTWKSERMQPTECNERLKGGSLARVNQCAVMWLQRNGAKRRTAQRTWLRPLTGREKKLHFDRLNDRPKRSAGVEIFLAACYTLESVFLWNKGSVWRIPFCLRCFSRGRFSAALGIVKTSFASALVCTKIAEH
jgi:hypothetical protein